jgi:prophage DNA circulation protein
MGEGMTLFESMPPASWKVSSSKELFFACTSISEDGANRLVERERPYRDGAKIDDTGSKARRWRVEVIFNNSVLEPGMKADLYPAILNDLIRSFDLHETGDLTLPTVGKIRARALTYSRVEAYDVRDEAKATFTWVEDNEDAVGARAFNPPTVKATALILAQQTTFSAASDATWDSTLADLNESAAKLEAIANFPGDTVQDLDAQAGIVVAATNRVLRAFTTERPTERARRQLTDPDASVTQRKLIQLKSTARKAKKDLSPEGIARIVIEDTSSLYAIAVNTNKNVEDLIRLNPGVNPLFVEKGSVITLPVPNEATP